MIHIFELNSKGVHSIGDNRDRDRVREVSGVWGGLGLDLVLGGIGDRWYPSIVGGVVGIATGPIFQDIANLSWVTAVLVVGWRGLGVFGGKSVYIISDYSTGIQ